MKKKKEGEREREVNVDRKPISPFSLILSLLF
jgi:hypothetical protein